MACLGHTTVGEGPIHVVIVHEWASASNLWNDVKGLLNGEAFTYAFLDLRGYGQSLQLEGQYSCREAATDIAETASSLGWTSFHAVGHSMGGMIAQRMAVDFPDRIRSIVGVAPVPPSAMAVDAEFETFLRAVPTDLEKARTLAGLVTGNRLSEGWYRRKLQLARTRIRSRAMLGYLDMWTGESFANELSASSIPMLAIVGGHDLPFYAESNLRTALGRHFQDLQVATIADAAHYPMCETPPYFVRILEDFLSRP